MTRKYSRLWDKQCVKRDSPSAVTVKGEIESENGKTKVKTSIPDVAPLPVHLYTHKSNVYPEEVIPEESNPHQTSFNPQSDPGLTSGYERCDDFDPNWDHHYREPSADLDNFYDDFEEYDDPGRQPSSPKEDYNSYPKDFEALDQQFQRLETDDLEFDRDPFGFCLCSNPEQHGCNVQWHTAQKETFFNEDANQHFHINCSECSDYLDEFYCTGCSECSFTDETHHAP